MSDFKDMLDDMESNPEFYKQFLDDKGGLLDKPSMEECDDVELLDYGGNEPTSKKLSNSLGSNSCSSSSSGSNSSLSSLSSLSSNLDDADLYNNDSIYVRGTINDNSTLFCLDTNSSVSIISKREAKKLKMFNLMKPYHKKIKKNNLTFLNDGLGFLENVPVIMDNEIFHFDFNVYESNNIHTTLGLDNLLKYKAIINLESNYLKLGSTITKFSVFGEEPKKYSKQNYDKLCELGFNTDLIIKTLVENNDNLELSIAKLLSCN